ncbi:probable polygalacturonase At3g15720 [Impatiens glandulifera]|uniref:probable polygalacturonase At3g15720 n=1 Tax=Impatiens glandulifera TaxID=253017 RepID=UPI001FB12195|nr:probable polygalacturonase At3g15720 [Impatiens glandulifera]
MSETVLNVMNYGAIGDGKRDDSQAFLRVWEAACQTTHVPRVFIPNRTFLLKPLTFSGPCKSSLIYFQIMGKIVAPNSKNAWSDRPTNTWLFFYGINGLSLSGSGQFDGQGSIWWSNPCLHNSAQNAAGKCKAPAVVTFKRCNNLKINGLTSINPMNNHMQLTTCKNVTISHIRINAPKNSPNTDGIDIANSHSVKIRNSVITTGDDCIAISGGSSDIDISGIFCGPGHGISVGALGHGGYDVVENVKVYNCTFKETLTGVRIKSWQTSAVKVSDVSFTSIVGTSNMDQVINLSCSKSFGCTNIVLDRIDISLATKGRKPFATCINAHGKATNTKPAIKCLLP